ncbi:NosD domain-containing protein [Methanohalophilus levihalophilus]|uniref:NosD domain-containing protein n=1 Tax=Methanohalophilus levihalophilus TaxID=1431282 RepID=UPI001AE8C83F
MYNDNHTLYNNTVNYNEKDGIRLSRSSYNDLKGNTVNYNGYNGIWLDGSYKNTFTSNTVNYNEDDGISLNDSTNNTFIGNTAEDNGYGIGLLSSRNNLLYNNIFNNSNNFIFSGTNTGNQWNLAKTVGKNIAGGAYLGGNYWLKPDGTGFSQINDTDVNVDGFCDSAYYLDVNNTDQLPLTKGPVLLLNVTDAPGSNNYTTIQGAINNASAGVTILVYPGTYTENVVVNKTVNLTSTGGASVTHVIAADVNDHVFNVSNVDDVTISGFNVSGASGSWASGILLYESSYNTLGGNMAEDNFIGIYLVSSTDNTMDGSTANNNSYGIRLYKSSDSELTDNTANYNKYDGIWLEDSIYNKLTENIASYNKYDGIWLEDSSNSNILANNTANYNKENGILLWSFCNNNTLTGNTAENNTQYGIGLLSSSNNLIYNNFFNNTNNTAFEGTNIGNQWNITKTAGTNIAGGSHLGGNYWLKPDGTGFSQVNTTDANGDGICDLNYTLSGTNIDYLPLVQPVSSSDSPASSSAKSGGSGGGGGGNTGESFENILAKDAQLSIVVADGVSLYEFKEEMCNISYVQFRGVSNTGQISTIIEVLKNTSALVDSPVPGNVYQNLNIWVGNAAFGDDKIKDAVIGFRVSKEWLLENGIEASAIALYRYNDGQWNELSTIQIDENDKYIYFEAKTPGFSPFAISISMSRVTVGEDALPSSVFSEKPVEDLSSADDPLPDSKATPGFSLLLSAIVLISLFAMKKRKH